jgi:DNA-binding IclR family transcriptional regulator
MTGQTASISVLAGESAQLVNQIFGHRTPRLPNVISGTTRFPRSAIGQILHAYQVGQDIGHRGAPDINQLSEIRRTGLAQVDDVVQKVTTIAVPLTGVQRPAALAVTGQLNQVNPRIAARALRRAAFEFGRTLMAYRVIANPLERTASQ